MVIEAVTRRDRARLTVTDLGRGIDPEDLPTTFEEHERGRLAQADGGTGLGLTRVRQLVVQQGGRVWIDSEVGRGTTATVELPAAAAGRPGARAGEVASGCC